MATAESVKTQLQTLIVSANAVTGNADTDLTAAVNALIEGHGSGGGASGLYMAKVTPTEYQSNLTIEHGLGTTDILLVAAWAETLGDYVPETSSTLCKYWLKTDIPTQRGGNGFSAGYSWQPTYAYSAPNNPNVASYETLVVTDENTVKLDRVQSGTTTGYLAGVTYTVVVIAANAEV